MRHTLMRLVMIVTLVEYGCAVEPESTDPIGLPELDNQASGDMAAPGPAGPPPRPCIKAESCAEEWACVGQLGPAPGPGMWRCGEDGLLICEVIAETCEPGE